MRARTGPAHGDGVRRRRGRRKGWVAAVALLACGCGPGQSADPPSAPRSAAVLDAESRRWAEETLAGLTLREAAAQLVIPWIPGGYEAAGDPGFQEILDWVDQGIGGVSISIGVPDTYAAKLNRLQARARIPLLATSDFENGGPGMRINHSYALPSLLPQGGGTSFPPTMAFGAAGSEDLAFEFGRVTAAEARAVGVHWLFAPVLDVNSNPANPVINTRSFGENPALVGRLGAAFVRGARSGGALTTAKHFPGHGDTHADSHVELPVVAADRARLDSVELAPFRAALDAGADAVMTAHVAVPNVLGDARPATMAPEFMTGLLREEMGFDGILFTDALRMAAITDAYGAAEASVAALQAGSDVLLAPADPAAAIEAVALAVERGLLSRDRLDRSVRRILEAKARLGLHRERFVDPLAVADRVGAPAHRALAERAAAESMTLVRDRGGVVPLRHGQSVLSVTYARPGNLLAGRAFDAELRAASFRVSSARVGPETRWAAYDSLLHAARSVDVVVVGAYVPPRSGAGAPVLSAAFRAFARGAGDAGSDGARTGETAGKLALVSFGSPYVLADMPGVGAYMAAWGDREVSQRAAARALAGGAAVRGRLPVSIPGLHAAGEGLDREAVERVAGVGARAGADPLQEAGFVPGPRGEGPGAAEMQDTTGGPGRWRLPPPLPGCDALGFAPGQARGAGVPAGAGPDAEAREPARGQAAAGSAAGTVLSRDSRAAAAGRDLADVFCVHDGMAVSPRESDPSLAGMDADSLAALDAVVLAALADSAASGAALAIVRRGRLVRLRGYGSLDWDPNAPPATPASIFDLASLTKVVATTTATLVLAQRGLLHLDDPVGRHLPWWAAGDPAKARVTLRHLLLHQAGLPPFRRFFLEIEGRRAYERAIAATPLDYPPGDRTVYSDIGLMTAAFVAETVSGAALDDFLRAEAWRPLGMGDTGFRPAPALWDRVATTEVDEDYRGLHVHGVAHDENAFAIGGVAGHAGLFSSARDLAVFAQMMLDRGIAGPCRADAESSVPCHRPRFAPVAVFAPGWVDRATRPPSPTESSRALGWDTPSGRSSAGDFFTRRAFGHTGYTGTSIWIDPALDLGVALLTNRVNPTRENAKHVPLRRRVHDLAATAITDTPPSRREAPSRPEAAERREAASPREPAIRSRPAGPGTTP